MQVQYLERTPPQQELMITSTVASLNETPDGSGKKDSVLVEMAISQVIAGCQHLACWCFMISMPLVPVTVQSREIDCNCPCNIRCFHACACPSPALRIGLLLLGRSATVLAHLSNNQA